MKWTDLSTHDKISLEGRQTNFIESYSLLIKMAQEHYGSKFSIETEFE